MDSKLKGNYWESLKFQISSFHSSSKNLYLNILQVFLLKSSINFIFYLSSTYYIEIWDVDDVTTGYLVSLNTLQFLFIFIGGNIIDRIGIKNSYILASVIGIISYGVLLLIKNLVLHIIIISLVLGFDALIIFTLVKTHMTLSSDYSNRSFGFSMLNCATQTSSIVYGGAIKLVFILYGVSTTSFNLIFILTITFFVISLVLTLVYLESSTENSSLKASSWTTFHNIKQAVNMKRFWKLIGVNLISSFSLTLVYQVGMVLPIYMIRELDNSSNYGLFVLGYSICVILFSFVMTPFFPLAEPYTFLVISTAIMALAPLALLVDSAYFGISVYVLLTAFGSCIFESRLTEYHAVAALPGMRGTYITLVNVSYSFAFLITGIVSGYSMDSFCPDDGERQCWVVWMITSALGFFAMLSFITFRTVIEFKYDQEETDPYVFSGNKD